MAHSDGYKPVISIVIPVHNESKKTIKCLASIRTWTSTPYEIIWVDNGSSSTEFDAIMRQVRKPRVHCKVVKLKKNVGFVKATNIGIKEVEDSSQYIILLNNDTEVTKDWDKGLIAPLKDDSIGAVGPITQSKISWQEPSHLNKRWKLNLPLYPSGAVANRDVEKYRENLTKYGDTHNKYVDVGVLPLSFFCVALRKDTLEKVGFLDEDFGIGLGDDDEYCHRLRTYGYKLMLCLDSFVFHWHRTTFRALKLPVDSIRRTNVKTLKRKCQTQPSV